MLDSSPNTKKSPKKIEKQTFNRLVLLYSIAVAAIVLIVFISERYLQLQLNGQLYDSKVVNLAGKQRMYSQRIIKDLLLLNQDTSIERRVELMAELHQDLEDWNKIHFGLINGDTIIGIPLINSSIINLKLDTLTRIQQDFYKEIKKALVVKSISYESNYNLLTPVMLKVLSLEEDYLFKMNEIVGLYEKQARRKVERAKNIQTLLSIITFGILFFEVLFIFRPLAISVRRQIKELLNSEWLLSRTVEKSKKLQAYLQASNDDLQNVYFALEEAALFARARSNGEVYYISDQFLEKLHFNKSKKFKYNVFKILDASEWVSQMENSTAEKSIWRNELKLKTYSGSFIWIDARIVPVLSKQNEVEDLLIICNDITHRKWAEQKVYQLNKERYLRKSAEQRKNSIIIIDALEKERKRISRDIHDGLGQLLTAIKFNIQSINLDNRVKAKAKLEEVKKHIGEIIKEARRISFNLAPSNLEDYGISSALKALAVKMQEQTDVKVLFIENYPYEGRLPKNIEVNIYRICQEAVNNALKHSKPSCITIGLSSEEEVLKVTIQDDGLGFDMSEFGRGDKQFTIASGILNMKERVNFFNGNFQLETSPGNGTQVSITLPHVNTIHA